ncbi:MAG: ATP-binding domain-containing protein, partial [Coriobacteriales bacterium]|nr:ATP-binding domain-containing protein [Coriobacteriales bacterium]
ALRTDLDSLADDDAAITLMTVHSAKGLEFPVVFISGLEETVFPHVAAFEEENGIEEERRLAYVAITRARELLYLTHTQVRSLYGATHVNPPSRFIHEIPTECMTLSGVGSAGFGGTGWEKRGDRHGMFGSGSDKETGRLFGSGAGSSGFGTGGGAGGAHKREAVEKFATGDLVDHKTFGRGRVISVNGDKLHIRFERSGEKDLLAGYAPIVKIK